MYHKLLDACLERGIPLDSQRTYRGADLLRLLTQHSLDHMNISKGMRLRASLESPMLCFPHPKVTLQQRRHILTSDRWIAEPKYYGCRVLACYFPEEGFSFFSRKISMDNFLPLDLSGRIIIPQGGIKFPEEFSGLYDYPFMVDGEFYAPKGILRKDERSPYLGLEQNYASFVLSLEDEEAREVQLTQFRLEYVVFDLLSLGGHSLLSFSLEERKKALEKLREDFGGFPFEIAPTREDKVAFYRELVQMGMEGCVLKNLDRPYDSTGKRCPDTQVALKRNIWRSFDDLDVFITDIPYKDAWGPRPSKLSVGVYVQNGEGFEEERNIGKIEIPEEMREVCFNAPARDDQRNHWTLRPGFFGAVLTVKAKNYDPVKKIFRKVVPNWKEGIRVDKHRLDCVILEKDLKADLV